MLDLNRIFGMREQMLPQKGLLGFVLNNWLVIAIVIMLLGFLIDQVLYVVRYRPQDKLVRLYTEAKKLYLRMTGKEAQEESNGAEEAYSVSESPDPVVNMGVSDHDAPVIRRGGAKYVPRTELQPDVPVVVRAPAAPMQPKPVQAKADIDTDAPLVVRAAAHPAPRVNNDREPDTRRGKV